MKARILALAFAVAAVVAAACAGPRGPAGVAPSATPTAAGSFEVTLQRASVGSANHVVVDFTLSNGEGAPRTLAGIDTFWTLAVLESDAVLGTTRWKSLITRHVTGAVGETDQPTSDPAGTITTTGSGAFRYRYSVPLPQGYDANATYRVGMWARWPNPPGVGDSDDAWVIRNAELDFVPGGGAPGVHEEITNEGCNVCHDRLAAHGGFRTDTKLCVTCHTRQLYDPDTEDTANSEPMNPLDFTVMVHRIHQGVDLPSMTAAQTSGVIGWKYSVVGFQGNESVFAETVASFTSGGEPDVEGVAFPQDTRNCTKCHRGANADAWRTVVDRLSCQSCHDATWFGPVASTPPRMTPHVGGPVADDTACATCHPSSMGNEFDPSVPGAHVNPLHSSQLRGLHIRVDDVAVSSTGGVTVVFEARNADDGSPITPLSSLGTLAITVSGPTTEYEFRNFDRVDVRAIATYDAGTGAYTAVLPARAATDPYDPNAAPIPPDATGTFALAIDARRSVTLTGDGTVTEPPDTNAVTYFTVGGTGTPAPRRQVVENQKCNACHDVLLAHGNQRRDTQYCVICHNPTQTDWARRPHVGGSVDIAATVDQIEERSVDFPVLIHRIHTGEDLDRTRPFVVYGFGGSPNRFDEVRFPGNRARCTTCHKDETYTIESIPAQAGPVVANETSTPLHGASAVHPPDDPQLPPIQAACLACHDSDAAWTHAQINTSGTSETCIVCHGEGRTADVRLVHDVLDEPGE